MAWLENGMKMKKNIRSRRFQRPLLFRCCYFLLLHCRRRRSICDDIQRFIFFDCGFLSSAFALIDLRFLIVGRSGWQDGSDADGIPRNRSLILSKVIDLSRNSSACNFSRLSICSLLSEPIGKPSVRIIALQFRKTLKNTDSEEIKLKQINHVSTFSMVAKLEVNKNEERFNNFKIYKDDFDEVMNHLHFRLFSQLKSPTTFQLHSFSLFLRVEQVAKMQSK